MDGLTLHIEWEYFLGIMASLIVIAWYTNGRFTALETSMDWVKDILKELKVDADNSRSPSPAFGAGSPVNLKPTGEKWLNQSGLKQYIEDKKNELMKICEEKKDTNPYEVQEHIFKAFDTLKFNSDFEDNLKKFAYEQGTSMSVLRRIGAIYFRNICLDNFGMRCVEIDIHDPNK